MCIIFSAQRVKCVAVCWQPRIEIALAIPSDNQVRVMFRIAICDDEAHCRERLGVILRKYAADNSLDFDILYYESADALLINYPKDLDVLLLDIAMDGVDGMAAAHSIRKTDPTVCIIFVTTMYQYAIDGYAVKAFGFICKPINAAELSHELTCALTMINNTRAREQFITTKCGGVFHRLPISRISYCEVKNHQIDIHKDDEVLHCRDSMNELVSRLSPLGFFRCHNSFLVNGEHIASIEQNQLTLKDGRIIPISQRRRKEFMQEISDFLGCTI